MLEESLTLANNHIAFLTGLTGENLKIFGITTSDKGSKKRVEEVKREQSQEEVKDSNLTQGMQTLTELLNAKSKVSLTRV
jgi:hypothetical protein